MLTISKILLLGSSQ